MYLEHGNPFSLKHPRTQNVICALLLTVFKTQSVIDKQNLSITLEVKENGLFQKPCAEAEKPVAVGV